jgi:HK97 family phage major capsid protein
MAKLFELKQQHQHALNKAEGILMAAENAGRELTAAESMDMDMAIRASRDLEGQIKAAERNNTLKTLLNVRGGQLIPSGASAGENGARGFVNPAPLRLSEEYADAFYGYIGSAGKNVSAALYEGSSGAGGFAVPITVDSEIVPLAPQEMGVRRVAKVIPTLMDMKVPIKGSFGVASAKAENAPFVESDPSIANSSFRPT